MKLALMLLAFVSFQAMAYDYSHKFGIGAGAGYNIPTGGNAFNDAADSDWALSLHGRYHFTSQYGVEAAYSRHDFSDTTMAAQVFDLTGFMRLFPLARFTPIFGLGAGVVDVSHYDPNSLKLGLKARVGVEYSICENLTGAFNVDYQHINKMIGAANLPTGNAHVIVPKVQITWYFGQGEKSAAPVVATKAPVKAEAPKDTDGDGVIDSLDKCANTPASTPVNAFGCAKEEKGEVHLDVEFSSGKAVIAAEYDSQLSELAQFMKTHAQTTIEVQGHTDSTGSKALNKTISQKRADAVKNYLVSKFSVEAARLKSVGYGDTQPVASNDTAEGKQKNRRVIAVISH